MNGRITVLSPSLFFPIDLPLFSLSSPAPHVRATCGVSPHSPVRPVGRGVWAGAEAGLGASRRRQRREVRGAGARACVCVGARRSSGLFAEWRGRGVCARTCFGWRVRARAFSRPRSVPAALDGPAASRLRRCRCRRASGLRELRGRESRAACCEPRPGPPCESEFFSSSSSSASRTDPSLPRAPSRRAAGSIAGSLRRRSDCPTARRGGAVGGSSQGRSGAGSGVRERLLQVRRLAARWCDGGAEGGARPRHHNTRHLLTCAERSGSRTWVGLASRLAPGVP